MKKLLSLALASFGLLFGASVFADGSFADTAVQTTSAVTHQVVGDLPIDSEDGHAYSNKEFCCGEPEEHPCGDSYCLYCKYEPCYYNEWQTVCEPKCYEKKCCRYVAKEYEKTCVKYVPQYYTQTCCRYEPEYFTTTEVRNCSRKVCQKKCKWVPKYYYKRVCNENPVVCEPVICPTVCPPACK